MNVEKQWKSFLETRPDEREVVAFVLSRLTPLFDIKTEVTGDHVEGGRFRVDAVASGMHEETPFSFGLEFKRPSELSNPERVLEQAANYTNTIWRGIGGRIPIFVCPDPYDPVIKSPEQWSDQPTSVAYRINDAYWIGGIRMSNDFGIMLQTLAGVCWTEKGGITPLGLSLARSRVERPVGQMAPTIYRRAGDGLFVADFLLHYDDQGQRKRQRLYAQTMAKLGEKIEKYANDLKTAA